MMKAAAAADSAQRLMNNHQESIRELFALLVKFLRGAFFATQTKGQT